MRRNIDFNKKIKIILVDDNFEHLLGIRELINLETGFEVIATATNANIAINFIIVLLFSKFFLTNLCR